MKKILLLPIFVSFFCDIGTADALTSCNSIIKDNYAHDANGNLTADGRAEMETDCKQNGCFFDLGVCRFCSTDTYGSGGSCHPCGDLTFRQNYKGYWNHSDKYKTQLSGSCYAKCSEHKPEQSIPNGYWKANQSTVYYKAASLATCSYSVACNNAHYMTYNGSVYSCPACSDLSITRNGQTYTGYWTNGPGGRAAANSCSATCNNSRLPTPETGVVTYEKSSVNYPSECIPKTCQNSTDKCKGYALVTPYSCPNNKFLCKRNLIGNDGTSTTLYFCANSLKESLKCITANTPATAGTKACLPYTKEHTSGLETGAAKGYTILNTSDGTYPITSMRIYECAKGYHLQTPVKTDTDHCTNRKYGKCISDQMTCNANNLDVCTGGETNEIKVGAILMWDNTIQDWRANDKCICVSQKEAVSNGTANIIKTYVSGDKNNGNTKWNKSKLVVTSCAAGYYANKDNTACIPVEDGFYSPAGDLKQSACIDVPYSGTTYNYYNHSDGERSDAANCYVKCSERPAVLNSAGESILNGKWSWEGTEDEKRYAGSANYSCDDNLKLYCNMNYYGYGTGENRKCNLCSNLTDSIGQPGYWNNSKALNIGGETSCYAQCSDKTPPATNGEFTADKSRVYYDAISKAKCEYTLVCNEGYYRKNDGKNCDMCPAGSTSDKGADAITKCYMKGGPDGTEFCDNHGCFNLPTGVQIFYVGN